MNATATRCRGLSGLQVTILARAIENVWRRGDDEGDVHVYGCEVAADHFGWPSPYLLFRDRLGRQVCDIDPYCRRPRGVTAEEANRVHAAICRAFRRLEARGLGERVSGGPDRWSGFRLSEEGIRVAAKISRDAAMAPRKERPRHGSAIRRAGARRGVGGRRYLSVLEAGNHLEVPLETMEALIVRGLVRIIDGTDGGEGLPIFVLAEDLERLREAMRIIARD